MSNVSKIKQHRGFIFMKKRMLYICLTFSCAKVIHGAAAPAQIKTLEEFIASAQKQHSPHAILEVPLDASPKDIVTAYRKKSVYCHPDKNAHRQALAHEAFTILNQACTEALKIAGDATPHNPKEHAEQKNNAPDNQSETRGASKPEQPYIRMEDILKNSVPVEHPSSSYVSKAKEALNAGFNGIYSIGSSAAYYAAAAYYYLRPPAIENPAHNSVHASFSEQFK